MGYQESDTTRYLKELINKLQTSNFSLEQRVQDILDAINKTETVIDIKQPENVKGVKQLLCAIHTFKVWLSFQQQKNLL